MIIFLDCDGVFHPKAVRSEAEFFGADKMAVFEGVLDVLPQAQVVISSTWRFDEHIDNLYSLLSDKIKDRIIGITPIFPYPYEAGQYDGNREMEAQLWLEKYAPESPWIAIDDREYLFYDDAPLFAIDGKVGFLEEHKEQIVALANKEAARNIEEIVDRRQFVISSHKANHRGLELDHDFFPS